MTADTLAIADFPSKYYDHAITYAAYLVLCRREIDLNDMIRIYTQVEEDIELAGSASNALQLVQVKKQMMLQKYQQMMNIEVKE